MSVTERTARMGLCSLQPLGSPPLVRAVEEFGAVDVWRGLLAQPDGGALSRKAALVDTGLVERAAAACGARFLIPSDQEWPARLDDLHRADVAGQTGPPFGLWVRGASLEGLGGGVAVVGARACTSYGEQASITLAADLAAAGIPVISGLAFGVDAAAHRGALGVQGLTAAVVASGLDDPYPSANARLAQAVAGRGALVSELPPGARPTRYAFLARNRLIAALSEAVVVVEASSRSGAKNTASWGLALGRHVMAVPGPITSSLSATPHRLIRDGEAVLVSSAQEILALLAPLGSAPEPSGRGAKRPMDALAPPLREIREAVHTREEVTASELAARTGQTMVEALANAAELVESGWLAEGDEGGFRLPGRRR